MMQKPRVLWLAALLAIAAPAAAHADAIMKMSADSTTFKTFLSPDKLREEIGQDQVIIFRGDQQVLYHISRGTKTYSEMTRDDIVAAKSKLEQMKTQMDLMMKNMPPEKREMMEKMMKEKLPMAASDIKRTVKPTGEKKTIDGYPCAEYLVTTDGGPSSDVWATDITSLGIDPKDLAVLKGFGDFVSGLLPAEYLQDLTKDFENPGPEDVPGFPVLTTVKDASGKEVSHIALGKVVVAAVPAEMFELPEGFQKVASPFGASPSQK